MSFPNVIKDPQGIPISEVYVPNVGFKALQGGTSSTDGSSNDSAPASVVAETLISNALRNGQGYGISTGNVGAPAGGANLPVSIFNAASSKTIVIYQARTYSQGGAFIHKIQQVTTNPGYAHSLTPYSKNFSATASALASTCTYDIVDTALPGTQIEVIHNNQGDDINSFDLISWPDVLILPANGNKGYVFMVGANANGSWGINIKWVELSY